MTSQELNKFGPELPPVKNVNSENVNKNLPNDIAAKDQANIEQCVAKIKNKFNNIHLSKVLSKIYNPNYDDKDYATVINTILNKFGIEVDENPGKNLAKLMELFKENPYQEDFIAFINNFNLNDIPIQQEQCSNKVDKSSKSSYVSIDSDEIETTSKIRFNSTKISDDCSTLIIDQSPIKIDDEDFDKVKTLLETTFMSISEHNDKNTPKQMEEKKDINDLSLEIQLPPKFLTPEQQKVINTSLDMDLSSDISDTENFDKFLSQFDINSDQPKNEGQDPHCFLKVLQQQNVSMDLDDDDDDENNENIENIKHDNISMIFDDETKQKSILEDESFSFNELTSNEVQHQKNDTKIENPRHLNLSTFNSISLKNDNIPVLEQSTNPMFEQITFSATNTVERPNISDLIRPPIRMNKLNQTNISEIFTDTKVSSDLIEEKMDTFLDILDSKTINESEKVKPKESFNNSSLAFKETIDSLKQTKSTQLFDQITFSSAATHTNLKVSQLNKENSAVSDFELTEEQKQENCETTFTINDHSFNELKRPLVSKLVRQPIKMVKLDDTDLSKFITKPIMESTHMAALTNEFDFIIDQTSIKDEIEKKNNEKSVDKNISNNETEDKNMSKLICSPIKEKETVQPEIIENIESNELKTNIEPIENNQIEPVEQDKNNNNEENTKIIDKNVSIQIKRSDTTKFIRPKAITGFTVAQINNELAEFKQELTTNYKPINNLKPRTSLNYSTNKLPHYKLPPPISKSSFRVSLCTMKTKTIADPLQNLSTEFDQTGNQMPSVFNITNMGKSCGLTLRDKLLEKINEKEQKQEMENKAKEISLQIKENESSKISDQIKTVDEVEESNQNKDNNVNKQEMNELIDPIESDVDCKIPEEEKEKTTEENRSIIENLEIKSITEHVETYSYSENCSKNNSNNDEVEKKSMISQSESDISDIDESIELDISKETTDTEKERSISPIEKENPVSDTQRLYDEDEDEIIELPKNFNDTTALDITADFTIWLNEIDNEDNYFKNTDYSIREFTKPIDDLEMSQNLPMFDFLKTMNFQKFNVRVQSISENSMVLRYLFSTLEVRIHFGSIIKPKFNCSNKDTKAREIVRIDLISLLDDKKPLTLDVFRGWEDKPLYNGDFFLWAFKEEHRPLLYLAHDYVLMHFEEKRNFFEKKYQDTSKLEELINELSILVTPARNLAIELRLLVLKRIVKILPKDSQGRFQ